MNVISRGVESKVSSLMLAMNRELRAHPNAMAVFRRLLLDGGSHWRALSAYLSERQNICFHQCKYEDEAWLFPCEVGRGVFDACYKAWRGGAKRSNTRELTIHDAARMFWGVLRTHTLLEDLVYHDFQGHPKLATYLIEHLFQNRLSPGVVEGLRTMVAGMKKDLDSTTSLANKLKTKAGI
jgi:hypothetical protein